MNIPFSKDRVGSLAARGGLSLLLLGSIGLIADSQTPPSGAAGSNPALRLAHPSPAGNRHAADRQGAGLPTLAAAGDMIGFSHTDTGGTQTITLVHTEKLWMAVYHIDKSGTVRLVSSRPLDADFSLQLNATSPLPEEIRALGRR